jgi:hypothetical protein
MHTSPIHTDLSDAQRLLLIHLRAQDGRSTHEELLRWAPGAGLSTDDLDRSLVCAERAALLDVTVGEPPCTATRTVALRQW